MKYRLVQSIRVYLAAGRMFSIEFRDVHVLIIIKMTKPSEIQTN